METGEMTVEEMRRRMHYLSDRRSTITQAMKDLLKKDKWTPNQRQRFGTYDMFLNLIEREFREFERQYSFRPKSLGKQEAMQDVAWSTAMHNTTHPEM